MKLWTWKEENLPSVGHAVRTAVAATLSVLLARLVRITRGVLGCHRHARGHAITAEFDCTPGDPEDRCQRIGRIARDSRISMLRREFGRVRTYDLCARTHIERASIGKSRIQLRRHDARNHRADSAPGGAMDCCGASFRGSITRNSSCPRGSGCLAGGAAAFRRC